MELRAGTYRRSGGRVRIGGAAGLERVPAVAAAAGMARVQIGGAAGMRRGGGDEAGHALRSRDSDRPPTALPVRHARAKCGGHSRIPTHGAGVMESESPASPISLAVSQQNFAARTCKVKGLLPHSDSSFKFMSRVVFKFMSRVDTLSACCPNSYSLLSRQMSTDSLLSNGYYFGPCRFTAKLSISSGQILQSPNIDPSSSMDLSNELLINERVGGYRRDTSSEQGLDDPLHLLHPANFLAPSLKHRFSFTDCN